MDTYDNVISLINEANSRTNLKGVRVSRRESIFYLRFGFKRKCWVLLICPMEILCVKISVTHMVDPS